MEGMPNIYQFLINDVVTNCFNILKEENEEGAIVKKLQKLWLSKLLPKANDYVDLDAIIERNEANKKNAKRRTSKVTSNKRGRVCGKNTKPRPVKVVKRNARKKNGVALKRRKSQPFFVENLENSDSSAVIGSENVCKNINERNNGHTQQLKKKVDVAHENKSNVIFQDPVAVHHTGVESGIVEVKSPGLSMPEIGFHEKIYVVRPFGDRSFEETDRGSPSASPSKMVILKTVFCRKKSERKVMDPRSSVIGSENMRQNQNKYNNEERLKTTVGKRMKRIFVDNFHKKCGPPDESREDKKRPCGPDMPDIGFHWNPCVEESFSDSHVHEIETPQLKNDLSDLDILDMDVHEKTYRNKKTRKGRKHHNISAKLSSHRRQHSEKNTSNKICLKLIRIGDRWKTIRPSVNDEERESN